MKFTLLVLMSSLFILNLQVSKAHAEKGEKRKPKVGDIQLEEVDRIERRIKSRQFSSVGFGPFGSSTDTDGGVMYGISYGRTWEASETGEIRFDAQAAASSSQQFFSLGLGYGYIPFTTDISPVIAAELGGGFAGYKKSGEFKSVGGFSGGVLAGLRFFRTADTQLEVMGSYHAVFAGDTPGIYGLQLRILY